MHHDSDADTKEYPPLVGKSEAERPQPLSAQVGVEIGALTHPGKVRPTNEDNFLAVRFGRSLLTLKTSLPDGQVPEYFAEMGYGLVVADGVGGAAAGEIASSLAISVGVNLALHSPKWTLVMTPQEIQENMETWRRRFRQIDFVLTERAHADPALSGMATTLTVACSVGDDLCLYHVGDSRAYLYRQGKLHRLTPDQTMAQALADAGLIAPEEVATHRLRHVLTNALGRSGGDIEAEIQHMRLADGDRVLLCTDGLTEMVPDARIADLLRHVEVSEEACEALVAAALEAGGKDNVTVVLARYTIPPGGST